MSRASELLRRFYEADLNSMGEQPTAPNPKLKDKKKKDNSVIVVEQEDGSTKEVADKPSELAMGLIVEQEHEGTVRAIIQRIKPDASEEEIQEILDDAYEMIATDHLKEFDKYYTELKKMEQFLSEPE